MAKVAKILAALFSELDGLCLTPRESSKVVTVTMTAGKVEAPAIQASAVNKIVVYQMKVPLVNGSTPWVVLGRILPHQQVASVKRANRLTRL